MTSEEKEKKKIESLEKINDAIKFAEKESKSILSTAERADVPLYIDTTVGLTKIRGGLSGEFAKYHIK